MLRLVCESLDEAISIPLAEETNNECFIDKWRNSGCTVGESSESGYVKTHFSACKINMPVINCTGMSSCSMSTTRIRDVTEISPPRL